MYMTEAEPNALCFGHPSDVDDASRAAQASSIDGGSIEAVATSVTWVGLWRSAARDEAPLRGDALAWSADEVRHFVDASAMPTEEYRDAEDSPCPYTGAGACWARKTHGGTEGKALQPWWVEAQSHSDGPADDESIPRKLEGWWRVLEYSPDPDNGTGEDLHADDLCFVEKLWSDRIRVFCTSRYRPVPVADIVPLDRVCDMQMRKNKGAYEGSGWDLLRDPGEAGDDPDEIRVGQRRKLLGGEYGQIKLRGMECEVISYVEWMDRWTVEIPMKDQKGKPMHIAVVPSQLCAPRLPRDPKPNARVSLGLALRRGALELHFGVASADQATTDASAAGGSSSSRDAGGPSNGFRLRLRFVSRVRPGGRTWMASAASMYRYHEVRFVASGDYGLVYRVLRMVDESKRILEDGEENPHLVLDVPRGCDKATIAKAYRRLARRWHPDKVPEADREKAEREFQRIHQAYENLQGDPENASDLLVLKSRHPAPPREIKKIPVENAFCTEVKCLSLVSQLRLPNVAKLVEAGPDNEYIVTWPYVAEALLPGSESDGVNQVDRVDLVRQGWSDYSRSRRCAQQVVRVMMSLIRHDVMVVDPIQNIIVDRESGEPLFIDFGRGETAGSIYTTRIKTFMKKILQLLVRSVAKASYDVAARFIRDLENTLFDEMEKWQDERTRDQKSALALADSKTKWQEGIEQCRSVWDSDDENPFRKMFKDAQGVFPRSQRTLRPPKLVESLDAPEESDEEPSQEPQEADDDPEGYCDADISNLTPVQRLLRAKRKKGRRSKLAKEKPSVKISVPELLPDGTLGLGLDDAGEDQRGVLVVEIHKKAERFGWAAGDRIVELNGKEIDDWDDFREAWALVKSFGSGAVFGVMREGVDAELDLKEPRCLHCGSKGSHLLRCATWTGKLPDGQDCAYFCNRDCQKEAWRAMKKRDGAGATATAVAEALGCQAQATSAPAA